MSRSGGTEQYRAMHAFVTALALVICCVALAVTTAFLCYFYMESAMKRHAFVLGLLFCVAMALLVGFAVAQEHHHPPQHAALHDEFYATWYRPDNRNASCCNKKDCEPVEARVINGQWHVLRPADQKWLPVPLTQIETERDSPDGRNHACFQPPGMQDTVYCFLPSSAM